MSKGQSPSCPNLHLSPLGRARLEGPNLHVRLWLLAALLILHVPATATRTHCRPPDHLPLATAGAAAAFSSTRLQPQPPTAFPCRPPTPKWLKVFDPIAPTNRQNLDGTHGDCGGRCSSPLLPCSLRNHDYPGTIGNSGFITPSSRRSRCTAAVAAPLREAEPSSSLGHLTHADFPILHQEFDGSKLVYFDNGETSQKPSSVMKKLDEYYQSYNSNVHRGIHALSAKATDAYEGARRKVANFVNAAASKEIVFTHNATEAINLVAYSWGLSNLKQGDEIILTVAEHHSAIVPWQFVSQKTGTTLKYVGLTKEEVPDIEQLKGLLSNKTKIVVVHLVSNVLDACQSVPHMLVDVQKLGADFLVASSHKVSDFYTANLRPCHRWSLSYVR